MFSSTITTTLRVGADRVNRTLDAQSIAEHVAQIGEETGQNLAGIALDCGVCPTGLITPWSREAMGIEATCDRLKSAPYSGGAIEQPNALTDAIAIVSYRRALHQRREADRIAKESKVKRG